MVSVVGAALVLALIMLLAKVSASSGQTDALQHAVDRMETLEFAQTYLDAFSRAVEFMCNTVRPGYDHKAAHRDMELAVACVERQARYLAAAERSHAQEAVG